MIIDDDGDKLTPKQVAQQIILYVISAKAAYWEESAQAGYGEVVYEKLTEREKQLINDQVQKQFDRVQKLFGQEGWIL